MNPQPAPAKRPPVSPAAHSPDSGAGDAPGTLPPVPRAPPEKGTLPAHHAVSGDEVAGMTQAAGELSGEMQASFATAAMGNIGAAQHILAPAAHAELMVGHSPHAVVITAARAESSEAATPPCDGLQSAAEPAESIMQSLQPLPALVLRDEAVSEAADGNNQAAPEQAGRRDSVIMMDVANTPEVSGVNLRHRRSDGSDC